MVLRQLKRELAELEKKPTGIRYFNTYAEFYMCKAEYEDIMAEIAAEEAESRPKQYTDNKVMRQS